MLHFIVALNSPGNRLRRLLGVRYRSTSIMSADSAYYRGQRVICHLHQGGLIHGRVIGDIGAPAGKAAGIVLTEDLTAHPTRYRRSTLRQFARLATENAHA